MKTNNIINDISILIAEDESELREYLKEYLELFFKNIFIAKCGKEAYEIYLQKKPDIIISDINMPNLDGLSMVQQIRESDNETNIIIMSAHSDRDKLLKAVELRLVKYLIKPINSQNLKDILFELTQKLRISKKRIYLNSNVYWDKVSRTLFQNDEQIYLKEKELLLFQLLCSKTNQIFTAKEIFEYLYKDQNNKDFSEYSITSFIKRLRVKLPQNLIQNEYGAGYKITPINK
ncbi:response regulator transcription factor [Sulfurimonas sp.]|uniref:response regulator transcription factor n=1 Tax=Sulfurimonas sp. TaxID=2022749 RepID=UPI002B468FFB|nr:response regulator transcription factor [Sulfurimonas sp.]